MALMLYFLGLTYKHPNGKQIIYLLEHIGSSSLEKSLKHKTFPETCYFSLHQSYLYFFRGGFSVFRDLDKIVHVSWNGAD